MHRTHKYKHTLRHRAYTNRICLWGEGQQRMGNLKTNDWKGSERGWCRNPSQLFHAFPDDSDALYRDATTQGQKRLSSTHVLIEIKLPPFWHLCPCPSLPATLVSDSCPPRPSTVLTEWYSFRHPFLPGEHPQEAWGAGIPAASLEGWLARTSAPRTPHHAAWCPPAQPRQRQLCPPSEGGFFCSFHPSCCIPGLLSIRHLLSGLCSCCETTPASPLPPAQPQLFSS